MSGKWANHFHTEYNGQGYLGHMVCGSFPCMNKKLWKHEKSSSILSRSMLVLFIFMGIDMTIELESPNVIFILMIISYLIGSTVSAIWIAKFFKLPDPRSFGSHNPGATNMARSNHKLAALLTFCMDIGKGLLSTGMAISLGHSLQIAHLCGACAVLGHIYPAYHNFKGGKGAATYFGVIAMLSGTCGLISISIWGGTLYLFKNSGLSAVITASMTPVLIYMVPETSHLLLATIIVNALIIAKHSRNIETLLLQSSSRAQ